MESVSLFGSLPLGRVFQLLLLISGVLYSFAFFLICGTTLSPLLLFLYYFGSSGSLPFCFHSFPSCLWPRHQLLPILLSSSRIPQGSPVGSSLRSPPAPAASSPLPSASGEGSLRPRPQPLGSHPSRCGPPGLRCGAAPPSPPVPALPEGGRPGRLVIVTARRRERKDGGASARRA